MFCNKCGYKLGEGDNFCPKCGAKRVMLEEAPQSEKKLPEIKKPEVKIPEVKLPKINLNKKTIIAAAAALLALVLVLALGGGDKKEQAPAPTPIPTQMPAPEPSPIAFEGILPGINRYYAQQQGKDLFFSAEISEKNGAQQLRLFCREDSEIALAAIVEQYIENCLLPLGYEQLEGSSGEYYLKVPVEGYDDLQSQNHVINVIIFYDGEDGYGEIYIRASRQLELDELIPDETVLGFGKYCQLQKGEGAVKVSLFVEKDDRVAVHYSSEKLGYYTVSALLKDYIAEQLIPLGMEQIYEDVEIDNVLYAFDCYRVDEGEEWDGTVTCSDFEDHVNVRIKLPPSYVIDELEVAEDEESAEPTPAPTLKPAATPAPGSGGKGALAELVEKYSFSPSPAPTPIPDAGCDTAMSGAEPEHISLGIPMPDLNGYCDYRMDVEFVDELKNYVHVCYDGEPEDYELQRYMEDLVSRHDFVRAIEDQSRGIYGFDYYEQDIWTLYPGYGYKDEDDVAALIVCSGGVTHVYYSVDFDYGIAQSSSGTKLEDLVKKYSGNGGAAATATPAPAPTAQPDSSSTGCDYCGGDGRVNKQRIEPGKNGKSEIVYWTEDCIYCGI